MAGEVGEYRLRFDAYVKEDGARLDFFMKNRDLFFCEHTLGPIQTEKFKQRMGYIMETKELFAEKARVLREQHRKDLEEYEERLKAQRRFSIPEEPIECGMRPPSPETDALLRDKNNVGR